MELEMSISKDSLRKEFSKEYEKYYQVDKFVEEGFSRHTCKICRKNFWSIDDRDVCDDPEHTEYGFIKEKPKAIKYADMWRRFSDFFKKNNHKEIKRYPVVSRWRQDLYFTIASIQDFQRIENGMMSFEYGENPLIVPQICLRFGDIQNVGVTGRHFSSFMMAGQHAFNWPKEGYWKDRTIELNYDFLTNVLGVKKEDIVYSEDVWAMGDFSEFGPCLESFSNGLELVNSVFTQFEYFNGKIIEMKNQVVDVGWGFERLLWFYCGTDNAYEAVFNSGLAKFRKEAGISIDESLFKKFSRLSSKLDVAETIDMKKAESEIIKKLGTTKDYYYKSMKPLQALYSVFDHSRTLLFAITDGSLPSNIGGGYNLRVILRRALAFMEEYNFAFDMMDVIEREATELKDIYPELNEKLATINEVIDTERRRFKSTKENAERIVSATIAKKSELDEKEVVMLYESHGITPEMLIDIAAKKGNIIEIPEKAYEGIVKGDFASKKKEKKELDISKGILEQMPKTKQMYYEMDTKDNAEVLYADKKNIILDKTPFYPEGGGQAADTGKIDDTEIIDVQKVGNVIVHVAKENRKIKKGELVECIVDTERRDRLIAHHTATHLISYASREVLGNHAWQEGARKEPDKAHIDIAHYEKLSDEEIKKIEDIANSALFKGIHVSVEELDRGEAESKYGFTIYQGHGVPAKRMRIVVIKDNKGNTIDAEACGGLHAVNMESGIGMIKIIGTARIHDGVDRIEFVAGKAALDYFRKDHDELSAVAQAVNSERFASEDKVKKLIDGNKEIMKEYDMIADSYAEQFVNGLKPTGSMMNVRAVGTRDLIRRIASRFTELNRDKVIIIINEGNDVVCMAGDDAKEDAIDAVRKEFGSRFRGGGSKKAAEGKLS